jgi:hypothetical protein
MRDTKIGEYDIGTYANELTLKVGELQSLQFLPNDGGPCWMTPAEREATRKDHPSGKMKRSQQKVVNLKKDLQAKGVL